MVSGAKVAALPALLDTTADRQPAQRPAGPGKACLGADRLDRARRNAPISAMAALFPRVPMGLGVSFGCWVGRPDTH